MPRAIALRRLGYRAAFRLLQVRWFLLRPRVRGVKCLVRDGDRVLLVRHTYGSRAWDLPGGGAHRDEPLLDVARREMEEELGLGSLPWRELGTLRGGLYHRRDTVGLLGAPTDGRPLRVDPVEIAWAAWFERDRLPLWLGPMVRPVLDNVLPPESGGRAAE